MSNNSTTPQRAVLLATLVVLAAVATAGIGAVAATQSGDASADLPRDGPAPTVSQFAGVSALWPFGPSLTDHVQLYDGDPSFIVGYSNDSGAFDDLQSWADQSDTRYVEEHLADQQLAVVVAPKEAVLPSYKFWRTGLHKQDYVVSLEPNYRLSTMEVENNKLSFRPDDSDWRSFFGIRDGRVGPQAGVAYAEDANTSTTGEMREAYGLDQISADASDVDVAIVDTGIRVPNGCSNAGPIYGNGTAGSDLRITHAYNTLTDESANISACNFTAVQDAHGHGSHVASTVAANATGTSHDGMAPSASIQVYKALGSDGSGSSAAIVQAIDKARGNDADILSLSLGSQVYSEEIERALDRYLSSGGTVAFVAAGNSRSPATPSPRWVNSPADSPLTGVVSVAATNYSANLSDAWSASFSSVGPDSGADLGVSRTRGATPDIAGIGMNVEAAMWSSSDAGAYRQNVTMSGTSMATPSVSGVAAVVLAKRSGIRGDTPATVNVLLSSATDAPHIGCTESATGVINATAALDAQTDNESRTCVTTDAAATRDTRNNGHSGGAGWF